MNLIMHIGAGKTGTTSIQANLEKHSVLLREKGVFYAGMYFENLTENIHLKATRLEEFTKDYYNDNENFLIKVKESLMSLRKQPNSSSIRDVVWVNESLFDSPELIMKAIDACSNVINEVKIIYYIRRQDAWLKSAYQQWGIKHKTYGGVVKDFNEWYPLMKDSVDYTSILSEWERFISRENIEVVIYENCKEGVVKDFFTRINLGVDVDLDTMRSNESLGKYQLSIFKLYNSLFEGGKLPSDISSFINRLDLADLNVPEINADIGFPSAEKLKGLMSEFDNNGLKKYSKLSGSIEFSDKSLNNDSDGIINRDSLTAVLIYSLVKLERRVTFLERKIKNT